MTTSTPDPDFKVGGAFADGLTLVRFVLTPIIMFVIIKGGWPAIDPAVLASVLFAVAAITDIVDDKVGGGEGSKGRAFGWFDDIADTFLITGTLAAMFWVLKSTGSLSWKFAVPALAIIIRDVLIALFKGSEFKKTGWPETKFGSIRTVISMLAICLLVASPWLSNFVGSLAADNAEGVTGIYGALWVGQLALGLLWLAALFSLVTGMQLLTGKSGKAANDA